MDQWRRSLPSGINGKECWYAFSLQTVLWGNRWGGIVYQAMWLRMYVELMIRLYSDLSWKSYPSTRNLMIYWKNFDYKNDAKREDSIGIDRHFLLPGHDFDRDFRLIVIEISNKNLTKEQTRMALLRREDFWIKKLETLEPNGYNDRLNFPNE